MIDEEIMEDATELVVSDEDQNNSTENDVSLEAKTEPTVTIPTKTSEVKSGQTVRIHERIKDITPKGEPRERIQIFEGIVLGIKGAGISRTLTVRKISSGGFGVERIYPIHSPIIAKIELVKTAKVRRAKLSFLSKTKHPFKRTLKETYQKKETGKKSKKK